MQKAIVYGKAEGRKKYFYTGASQGVVPTTTQDSLRLSKQAGRGAG